MLRPRWRGGFFLRLLLFYALLAAPWPGLQSAYSAACSAVGNRLFESFGPDGAVRFDPYDGKKEKKDTTVRFGNKRRHAIGKTLLSFRLLGYLPTAGVVALILATPIPWRRRGIALLLGLVLAHAVVLLRLIVVIIWNFSLDEPWAQYAPSPFWMDVLAAAYHVGAVWYSFTFVAPIFIWLVVTLRRKDWQRWRGLIMGAEQDPARTEPSGPRSAR